jgi:hypothetical protein
VISLIVNSVQEETGERGEILSGWGLMARLKEDDKRLEFLVNSAVEWDLALIEEPSNMAVELLLPFTFSDDPDVQNGWQQPKEVIKRVRSILEDGNHGDHLVVQVVK